MHKEGWGGTHQGSLLMIMLQKKKTNGNSMHACIYIHTHRNNKYIPQRTERVDTKASEKEKNENIMQTKFWRSSTSCFTKYPYIKDVVTAKTNAARNYPHKENIILQQTKKGGGEPGH